MGKIKTWLTQNPLRRRLAIALIAGVVAVIVILAIPTKHLTDPVVKLLTAMVWPYVLIVAMVFFRPQIEVLLSQLATRVESGAPFKLGGIFEFPAFSLERQAQTIPAPSDGQVTLENVALLHTSFYSPKKTAEFDDGLIYYQFEVIVIAPDPVMDRIESVTYRLAEAYQKNRTQVVTNRATRFKMKELANGTSIVCADIRFRDHGVLQLNRFIDLRREGPRL